MVTNATYPERDDETLSARSASLRLFEFVKNQCESKQESRSVRIKNLCMRSRFRQEAAGAGGANRDRTGDLLLAKQALSQLSYGPLWRVVTVRRGIARRLEG